ncbi:STAS domain-containing protein [bacterium]|nr:STAS domain-containing protein [bacterium]
MDFRVEKEELGSERFLIVVHGELDAYNSSEVKKMFKEITDQKKYNIIVDLENTTYMDSQGIGALLGRLSYLRKNKGDLWLVISRESGAYRFFEITGLFQSFQCFSDREKMQKAIDDKENR